MDSSGTIVKLGTASMLLLSSNLTWTHHRQLLWFPPPTPSVQPDQQLELGCLSDSICITMGGVWLSITPRTAYHCLHLHGWFVTVYISAVILSVTGNAAWISPRLEFHNFRSNSTWSWIFFIVYLYNSIHFPYIWTVGDCFESLKSRFCCGCRLVQIKSFTVYSIMLVY